MLAESDSSLYKHHSPSMVPRTPALTFCPLYKIIMVSGGRANEIDETCNVNDHSFVEPVNSFALAQLVTHIYNLNFEIIF